MNAIVRITEEELIAAGARRTRLGLIKQWYICEQIAQKLAQRLSGQFTTSLEDIVGKSNAIFYMAETHWTDSWREASKQQGLFLDVFRQARHHSIEFAFVLPYDVEVDRQILWECEEFGSLGDYLKHYGESEYYWALLEQMKATNFDDLETDLFKKPRKLR